VGIGWAFSTVLNRPGREMIIYFSLAPELRMRGARPPLLRMPFWRGA